MENQELSYPLNSEISGLLSPKPTLWEDPFSAMGQAPSQLTSVELDVLPVSPLDTSNDSLDSASDSEIRWLTQNLESEQGSDSLLGTPLVVNLEVASELFSAIGEGWSLEAIETILRDRGLPDTKILPNLSSQGAFSSDTNTIYLSQDFLAQNAHQPQEIARVWLEELGHYLDSYLNPSDTPGDEGAIFASVVLKDPLTPSDLERLRLEDDRSILFINGQYLPVELSTKDIVGTPGRDTLVGTANSDRIIGGAGADIIWGKGGNDIFVYRSLNDAGDTIKDFEIGKDRIDLQEVLKSFGYSGVNPLGDGYVSLSAYSQGTQVSLDLDGRGGRLAARPFIKVEKVTPQQLGSILEHFIPSPPPVLLELSAALANDTGASNSDRLTLDPTINGQIKSDRPITSLQGSLNSGSAIDISSALKADGAFTLSLEQYEALSNGSLPDGNYSLVLQATNDRGGKSAPVTVSFTLDRTPPPLDFNLAPASDTGVLGDKITSDRTVTLIGQTDPNLEVLLVETQQKFRADATGKFIFTNVPMPVAGQAPFTMVALDAAGNQGRVLNYLTREGINGAPEITSNPETVFDTTQQTTYIYQIVATDPDSDSLTYTLLNAPQGTEIDENGLISFTPSGTLQPSYDFSVEVSDGRGGTDTQVFTVEVPSVGDPLGTIRGITWNDLNNNGIQDGKPELAGVNVYLDLNNNGILEANEPIQITATDDLNTPDIDETGQYEFTGLEPDTYIVREVVPSGYKQTFPEAKFHTIEIQPKQIVENVNFGNVLKQTGDRQVDLTISNIDSENLVVDGQLLTVSGQVSAQITNQGLDALNEPFKVSFFEDRNINQAYDEGIDTILGSVEVNTPLASGQNTTVTTNLSGLVSSANTTIWGFVDSEKVIAENDETNNLTFSGAGEIRGTKWEDINGNGIRDGEPGLADVRVYLDLNNNGSLDANEPSRITAADNPNTLEVDETGLYRFANLSAGTYIVREVLPFGYKQTFPGLLGTTTTKTINFDSIVGMVNIPGATVPVNAQLSDEFLLSDGVIFSSESSYISVVDITTGLPLGHTSSPFNGIGGATIDGRMSYSSPIIGKFFLPSNPSVKAVANFVSVETDTWGVGTPVKLEVFDLQGTLIGSMSALDIDGPTLSISVEGIHSFSITGNGTSGFDDLTFGPLTSDPGFYTVQVETGEIVENIDFGNQRVNQVPVITSQPVIAAVTDVPYRYEIKANDPNGDPLTYTLIDAPDGMAIDENGVITWNPSAFGSYDVAVEVSDGQGGITTQNYTIAVGTDTEAPKVNLGLNSTVIEIGGTLNLQVSATDNVGVQDIDLSFNGTPLTLNPDLPKQVNTASVTLNQLGLFEVLATVTDSSGNIGTKTLQVRVIDPNDKDAPGIVFDLSQFDPLKPITEVTNLIGTISDDLESWRVEIAPVSLIDPNNPAANDPDYITIARGTGTVTNGVLAQIDPRLYRNDSYQVRIVAQDYSGNINVQGTVLGLYSENKPGEFRLEYTDLSVPLTGIPIQINRVYSSLDAQFQGDFGYGWNLALQDAQIQEASRDGRDLSGGNFDFGGNAFTIGTRVTLTTPDGRRVGFTFNPTPVGGSLFGVIYQPTFTPDPGVYDPLEVDNTTITVERDGSVVLPIFGLGFNPSEYRLKTREGIVYRYDQFEGLIDITDRNGNKLTYTNNGIFSSTGQSITFVRDAQDRITEIIDPDGKSLKYSYDADGNLIEFSDRTNNETTFEYEAEREHYLTEIVDPLGRIGVRTEYDEKGQISKIFDADGNALDIDYDSVNSRQTVKDPLGNSTTYVFDDRGNVVSEIDANGGITTRTYDDNNNLLSETDPEGNTKSYTYDSRGNKLSETDGEGNTKTYTYNANNKILTETDALGNITTYTYDANGNLTSRKDALGNVTIYKYGQFGLLTEVIDANGKTSTFSYDFYGNLTELVDPTGAKTKFTYDGNGRVTSVTDALGAITNYIYDAQGRLIEKADPEGSSCGCARGITKTEYNAAGEKIAEIDALGRRTEYRYSDRGLLIETIFPDLTPNDLSDNPRTKNEYDALDRLVVSIDELGRKTFYVYDKLGRQIEIIHPDSTPNHLGDNPRSKKEYDLSELVIAEIDELGNRTELAYDDADRLISRTNALGEITTYTYDADGRQISMTDALGRTTQYNYDALDRLISTTYANNTAMTSTYDALGRIIAETDLAGNTTKYEYDALGRLTTVVDALNQRTEYKYDAVGNLIEQKDANGNITQFEYDSLRRRKATILPGGQRNETIHNKIGNLIRVTDYNGATTEYKYDAFNRVIEKSFSDGTPTETFTYTLTSELATVTDNRGVTSYRYDERDRLSARIEPDGRAINYSYDAAGNITSLTVPSGITNYTYDSLNRLDTVIDPDSGITDYTYDAVGNLIKTQFANGVTENQQYDLLNRLTYLENRNETGILSSYTYTLDAVGNRTKVVENDGRVVDYSYDNLYRLIQEKITDSVVGNKTVQYKFDPVGNRLERIDSVEGTTTYTYDDNDRLIEEVLGGKVTEYQYDNNGNLIAKIENGQTQAQYEWNAKGELVAVEVTENGETGRIEYEYDHRGIRVAININGEETRFLIDTNQQQYAQVIEEYQANGTVQNTYVHGWDLISKEDANGRIYYQVDGLGSTRNLTDNNGVIVVEYDYDAYGNLTRKVGDASNNYLFTGEQFDEATDGYYLRARYYDPATGRFASTDPFEGLGDLPLTLHDYLYAVDNPVIYTDPSGLFVLLQYVSLLNKFISFPSSEATLNPSAIAASVVGFVQGFSIPMLFFVGFYLDDIQAENQWETAVNKTDQIMQELLFGFAGSEALLEKNDGIVGAYVTGIGPGIQMPQTRWNLAQRFYLLISPNIRLNTPSFGGLVNGKSFAIEYLRSLSP
jgi:RHS repeat-associated protein